jgi:hypothetical protein
MKKLLLLIFIVFLSFSSCATYVKYPPYQAHAVLYPSTELTLSTGVSTENFSISSTITPSYMKFSFTDTFFYLYRLTSLIIFFD